MWLWTSFWLGKCYCTTRGLHLVLRIHVCFLNFMNIELVFVVEICHSLQPLIIGLIFLCLRNFPRLNCMSLFSIQDTEICPWSIPHSRDIGMWSRLSQPQTPYKTAMQESSYPHGSCFEASLVAKAVWPLEAQCLRFWHLVSMIPAVDLSMGSDGGVCTSSPWTCSCLYTFNSDSVSTSDIFRAT